LDHDVHPKSGFGTLDYELSDMPQKRTTISEHVEESTRILTEVFGRQLLEDLRATASDPVQYSLVKQPGHPLGVAWKHLIDAKSKISKGLEINISKELSICIALSVYLDKIKDSKNLDRLVTDLSSRKDPEKYYKAFFEAHIASGFKSQGHSALFIEEGTEKTPDLEFHCNGKTIFAECKSLDPQNIEL
jgi:hypothetical protein